jgi:hypothetical protein
MNNSETNLSSDSEAAAVAGAAVEVTGAAPGAAAARARGHLFRDSSVDANLHTTSFVFSSFFVNSIRLRLTSSFLRAISGAGRLHLQAIFCGWFCAAGGCTLSWVRTWNLLTLWRCK